VKLKITSRKYFEGDYEKFIYPLEKENMKRYWDKHMGDNWSDEDNRKKFNEIVEHGWTYLFFDNGEFCAFTSFFPDEDEKDALFVYNIQVKDKFQNKGIGSWILNFVENKAREKGFKKLNAFVWKDNPAFKLWSRKGFNVIGTLEPNSFIVEKKT